MITFKEAKDAVLKGAKSRIMITDVGSHLQVADLAARGKSAIIRVEARSDSPDSWLTNVAVYEFGDYSIPLVGRTWRFALTECGVRQAVDKYNELCDKIASAELK